MSKVFIDIDHTTGKISNPDGEPLEIGDNGGIKIGYGDSLPANTETDDLQKYKGYTRINSTTGCLQICTGEEWLDVLTEKVRYEEENIINSLIF